MTLGYCSVAGVKEILENILKPEWTSELLSWRLEFESKDRLVLGLLETSGTSFDEPAVTWRAKCGYGPLTSLEVCQGVLQEV